LRVGTSSDYPPFSHAGVGFDVEVAGRLARHLDARVEWVQFRWEDLRRRVRAGDFDIAMSGVTWRPDRAVIGWMTRAVAAGGPCVVGAADPARVGVNRGGFLERWARGRFRDAQIHTVDDNLSLAPRLVAGELDAFVTDSFELPHVARSDWPSRCEPPLERKVYWIAPQRAATLGPEIDAWLARQEVELAALRAAWLGAAAPRNDADHLIDLLARRLALMPAVAAWKRARSLPAEDLPREVLVRDRAAEAAAARGLDTAAVRQLFRLQIDLAKRVQGRSHAPTEELDLDSELRPALGRLGLRIVAALAAVAPLDAVALGDGRLAPLARWLEPDELASLREALLAVRRGA
jgi:chorismate mutase